MHGYVVDESSIDSMCSMHQDWCTKETIVTAFSLHQNGCRVMVQVTMRMKENNVAKAVELLQTKVFGKAIEGQETIQRDVKMSEQKTGSKRKSENALDHAAKKTTAIALAKVGVDASKKNNANLSKDNDVEMSEPKRQHQ